MMLKDFKRKAWYNNEWVYGCFIVTLTGYFIVTDDGEKLQVDSHTVCESTGRCDETGALIYQNDILFVRGSIGAWTVYWDGKQICYMVVCTADGEQQTLAQLLDTSDVLISGNICEPEIELCVK